MRKLILSLLTVLTASIAGYAQSPTITNGDLEKYRSERLKAQADLRENYERLGFPSPEERARREAEAAKAAAELTAKLRAERLERERIEAVRREQSVQTTPIQIVQAPAVDQGFYWLGGHWRVPQNGRRVWTQPGYFAGGAFWPTGNRTRPQPLFTNQKERDDLRMISLNDTIEP